MLARNTPLIQPLSLDEAYLDVTTPWLDHGSAAAIAAEIEAAIRAETGLIASAGVSYDRSLARLASHHRMPDGLLMITPRMKRHFFEDLAVDRFHAVDPVTVSRMKALGMHTRLGLQRQPRASRRGNSKEAAYLHGVARGVDERLLERGRRPQVGQC